jgi:hypothetical protein
MLQPIDELLSEEELGFVMAVAANPGCKYPGGYGANWDVFYPDGKPALYEKPQELGIIKAVGSFKWVLGDNVKTKLFIEVSDVISN